MSRQPRRITPQSGEGKARVVTFRDGPRCLSDAFAGLADTDVYPDLTYQEWVHQVVNRKNAMQAVNQAIGRVRAGHFAR